MRSVTVEAAAPVGLAAARLAAAMMVVAVAVAARAVAVGVATTPMVTGFGAIAIGIAPFVAAFAAAFEQAFLPARCRTVTTATAAATATPAATPATRALAALAIERRALGGRRRRCHVGVGYGAVRFRDGTCNDIPCSDGFCANRRGCRR